MTTPCTFGNVSYADYRDVGGMQVPFKLALVPRARTVACIIVWFTPWPGGASIWLGSMFVLHDHWGGIGLLIGLALGGVGVVPLAIASLLWEHLWFDAAGTVLIIIGWSVHVLAAPMLVEWINGWKKS